MSEPEEAKQEEIVPEEEAPIIESPVTEEKSPEDQSLLEQETEVTVVEESKDHVQTPATVEVFAISKYHRANFVGPLCDDELPHHELTSLHHTFGFPTERRDNLKYVEPNVLLYIAGNYLVKLDLRQQPPVRSYVMGVDGRGIGAFVIHPNEPLVVVGEKGSEPNIYIFEYPSWKVVKVLRKGAEMGYSTLAFSADGTKLASVASSPDFILTIWDWQNEKITLHTKAFGQDIFKVSFSFDDPGRLITSGTGHIRFWRMAKTFTGLKLQGDIGKFGKIELSDVDDFVELPDGKVLSGTESGALLLWEGNFIKYRIMRKDGQLPHNGAVTHIYLIRETQSPFKGVAFVTAGKDGKICWWDFKEIDEAEIDMDKTTDYEMNPLHEVMIGHGVSVRTIIRGHAKSDTPHVLVVDSHGSIWRMDLEESFTATKNRGGGDNGFHLDVACQAATKLFDFHSGKISCMDTSPIDHFAVTGGHDGSVRCWDYVARKELFKLTWGRDYEEEEAKKKKEDTKKRRPSRTPSLKAASSSSHDTQKTGVAEFVPTSVTTLKWAPLNVAPDGRSVFVGFSDGVVRVLWRGTVTDSSSTNKHSNKWVREQVLKPHAGDVTCLAFSPSGNMFASAGVDGNVFLFIDNKYSATVGFSRPASANGPKSTRKFDPLGFVCFNTEEDGNSTTAPTSLCFRQDGLALLVTCKDGRIAEINLNMIAPGGTITKGLGSVLTGESYELNLPIEFHTFKRPKVIHSSSKTNSNKNESNSPASPAPPQTPKPSSPSSGSSTPAHVANLFPFEEGDQVENEEGDAEVEELPLPPVLHAVYLRNRGHDALMVNSSASDSGVATDEQNELLRKQEEEAAAAEEEEEGGGDKETNSLGPKVSFSTPNEIDTSNQSNSSVSSSTNKTNGSLFVVSFGGDLAGKLFHCQFGKEEVIASFSLGCLSSVASSKLSSSSEDVFIPKSSCVRYSWSNQFLLTGADDGSVTVRQSGRTGERADPLEWCYLRSQPHDGDSRVTGVSLSYDNKFLLSAAEDGQMIIQRIKCHGIEPLALSGVVEHKRRVTALANAITYTPLAENADLLKDPLLKEGGSVGFGVAMGGAEGEVGPTPQGYEDAESAMQKELQNPTKPHKTLQEAADISDTNAYTIQDAKLKTDEDQRKQAAEVQKKEVLAAVAQLQKEFEILCAENESLPPETMLTEDELLVDPELASILNDKGNEMIEEVHRECAYGTEKSELRLMKLGDRFLDPVITEHCSLSTFDLVGTPYARSGAGSKGEVRCSNFVVPRPSEDLSELLESVSLEMRAEQASQRAAQNNDPRTRQNISLDKGGESLHGSDESFYGFQDEASTNGEKEKQSLEAQRKERRHARQAELAKMAEHKPGKHDDDPADVRAISLANKTMGDYKLKAADDYEVADGVVVNKKLKLRELVLYEDAIMKRKNAFNTKFFALRNEKRHTTVSVAQAILRINAITAELGDHGVDSCTTHQHTSSDDEDEEGGGVGAASSSSFSQMSGTQEEIPMPMLDAKNEWPSSRHLHTSEELAEFRFLVSEALEKGGGKTDENGRPRDVDLTQVMDALPPLSVVPGLRRGLVVTAEAAARFHAAHGGYGGDATRQAVAHYHKHNASSTHAVARSLSTHPVLHYLDHHRAYKRHKNNAARKKKEAELEKQPAFASSSPQASPQGPAKSKPKQKVNMEEGHTGGNFALFGEVKSDKKKQQEAEEEALMLQDELGGEGGYADNMLMMGLLDATSPDGMGEGLSMNKQSEEDEWVRKVLLEAERTSLKMRASAQLHSFNTALLALRRERMELAADFCGCEVTRLTRLRELRLLSEFEIKDQALANKIDKCTRDRGETAAAASETKSKIRAKKEECVRCKQAEAEVTRDFMRLVPPSHGFHAQLIKIFKRKIKRTKKRAHDENDDDDEDSESESDDEDDDEDEDEEDGEEEDDACPTGCDLPLYEEVLVLRVRRLDCEEKVVELTKLVDESEKAYTRLIAKEKQVEKELNLTTVEVRRYQTEKQKTLNQLLTPIPLKISQLCCFDIKDPLGVTSNTQQQMVVTTGGSSSTIGGSNDIDSSFDEGSSASIFSPFGSTQNNSTGIVSRNDGGDGDNMIETKLPPSKLLDVAEFGQHCVFPAAGLVGLAQRINSLRKETESERVNLSELHKTKKLLERARSTAEVSIQAQQEKNQGLQQLRFGQIIDMSVVEAGDSGAVSEEVASARIRKLETSNELAMRKQLKKQKALKESLLLATQENTQLLSRIADLSGRQFALEKELNGSSGNSNLIGDSGPSARADVDERNKLVTLVKLQAKEVEALKAEINLLRRKGGHVYVPPLPQASHNMDDAPQPPPM